MSDSVRTLFNFGKNNRLTIATVVDDENHEPMGYWISGRILSKYVSISIPRFWKN